MNNYEGKLDDPRFAINEKYGEEVWGWVLTDPHKNPIPEARWHCWRLCDTGWAHIFEVKYLDPIYLRTIVNRLGIQKVLTEKYGIKAYVKYLREEREAIQESDINEKNNQFIDIQKENKWLLDKAMDNFTQGRIAPTRPQKEIITSYSNQTNKSKIVRDITDREGGLYVPDSEDN
ncbi:MAG: hypothetical protein SVK08_00850 [Halobacteriota archaeon]|nr:hypothetical protein [Halobacteriota archaeon]